MQLRLCAHHAVYEARWIILCLPILDNYQPHVNRAIRYVVVGNVNKQSKGESAQQVLAGSFHFQNIRKTNGDVDVALNYCTVMIRVFQIFFIIIYKLRIYREYEIYFTLFIFSVLKCFNAVINKLFISYRYIIL
jgi:hypothetical protein